MSAREVKKALQKGSPCDFCLDPVGAGAWGEPCACERVMARCHAGHVFPWLDGVTYTWDSGDSSVGIPSHVDWWMCPRCSEDCEACMETEQPEFLGPTHQDVKGNFAAYVEHAAMRGAAFVWSEPAVGPFQREFDASRTDTLLALCVNCGSPYHSCYKVETGEWEERWCLECGYSATRVGVKASDYTYWHSKRRAVRSSVQ